MLFGQVEPTQIDVDELQAAAGPQRLPACERVARGGGIWVDKRSRKEATAGVAVDLLATYAGQAADLQEWMRDAQINTDRNLRLQYLAGMWLNSFTWHGNSGRHTPLLQVSREALSWLG